MRRPVLLALTVGLAAVMVTACSGSSSSKEPPAKQTVEAMQTEERATVEAGPEGPKRPEDFSRIPTPQSCPIDPSSYRTLIASPPIYGAPPTRLFPGVFGTVLSQALGLTSAGAPYSIYSGDRYGDPQQGVIVVGLGARDPCAEGRANYDPQQYLTPFKGGAVTLTQIVGGTVDFQAADGTTGRMDYLTGKFQ